MIYVLAKSLVECDCSLHRISIRFWECAILHCSSSQNPNVVLDILMMMKEWFGLYESSFAIELDFLSISCKLWVRHIFPYRLIGSFFRTATAPSNLSLHPLIVLVPKAFIQCFTQRDSTISNEFMSCPRWSLTYFSLDSLMSNPIFSHVFAYPTE